MTGAGARGSRRWWALGALAVSLLAVGLDLTILNVALPTVSTDLHASTSELQWFADSYSLVLAAVLLPAGLLGDRFGRKKLLLIALALFGFASLGCAYASSAGQLIAARAALGLGAAFLMPLSMSVLRVVFTDEERPRAIAIWAAANVVGIPLGPIVGGWLLDNFWWGSAFLINVPMTAIGLVAVAALLPESRSGERRRLDLAGVLTSSFGLVGITYGVISAGEHGWGDTAALIWLMGGAVLLAGFVWWQRRARDPLVELSLFGSAGFTWGGIVTTVVTFAMFGLLFVMPQYFQSVGGADALGTGLRLLPMIGGLLAGTGIANRLSPKLGAKITIAIGLVLVTSGLVAGATTGVHTGGGVVATWLALIGAGLGFALPAGMDVALGALSEERSGVGSALLMAMRQVGGAIGVAILGTVINSGYHARLNLAGLPEQAAEAVRKSVNTGVVVARQAGSPALLDSVRTAFVHGMDNTLWVCGGVTAVGVALTLAFVPARSAGTGRTGDEPAQSEREFVS